MPVAIRRACGRNDAAQAAPLPSPPSRERTRSATAGAAAASCRRQRPARNTLLSAIALPLAPRALAAARGARRADVREQTASGAQALPRRSRGAAGRARPGRAARKRPNTCTRARCCRYGAAGLGSSHKHLQHSWATVAVALDAMRHDAGARAPIQAQQDNIRAPPPWYMHTPSA